MAKVQALSAKKMTAAEGYSMCLTIRFSLLLTVALLVSACGAGKAVQTAGESFDRAGCLSREFKGQTPCPAPE
ncbi:hypothetical protein GCM10010136_12690 [Limoniibacter endophyticus]|uniref:Uncharacterized protein n=1 Tax=Limoniibacter endophyticus TaxID=1565040 RepID=A0A8J3DHF9_9HYPH|nr:hypothetical protein GCM10010136_12690 [Limoniibacter endophyticus]